MGNTNKSKKQKAQDVKKKSKKGNNSSGYIGTRETAIILGVSQQEVSKMCRENKIKGAEHDAKGSPWRIPRDVVMLMRKNK